MARPMSYKNNFLYSKDGSRIYINIFKCYFDSSLCRSRCEFYLAINSAKVLLCT